MKISREFILGDHTLNSHDLSDGLSIDMDPDFSSLSRACDTKYITSFSFFIVIHYFSNSFKIFHQV